MKQGLSEHDAYAYNKWQELIAGMVDLRAESYLSQKQVAEQLGLKTHTSINLMEQGRSAPRLDNLLRVLSVYGYTLELIKKPT